MKRNTLIFNFILFAAYCTSRGYNCLQSAHVFLSRKIKGSANTGEVSKAEKHVLLLVQLCDSGTEILQSEVVLYHCSSWFIQRLNCCLVGMFCSNQAFHRFLLLCGQPADSQPGDVDSVKPVGEVRTRS